MIPLARTQAEHTALSLQHAADGGSPVLIPGAWDTRAVAPAVREARGADPQSTVAARVWAAADPERIEREREGGGAPSQRPGADRVTFLTRLWRSTLHPTKIGVIWSRALPQPL